MQCPWCGENHDVDIITEKTKIVIKGETVEYDDIVYYCSNSEDDDAYFVPDDVMDENLLNAREAYRRLKNMVTAADIKNFRNKYGITQSELSAAMGWGDVTITRYETKSIQDEAHDSILRLIIENPTEFLAIFARHKDSFESQRFQQIRIQIINEINNDSQAVIKRECLEKYYAPYSEPCIENGYTSLNISKIEAVVSYLAEKFDNLHKVLLMKLLWYSDVLNYKLHGKAITGLVYRHMPMGALPIAHNLLIELSGINCVENYMDNYVNTSYCFYPNKSLKYRELLSESEIDVLERIYMKFNDYHGKKIADYMHEETAYKSTSNGDIITFAYASEIKEF